MKNNLKICLLFLLWGFGLLIIGCNKEQSETFSPTTIESTSDLSNLRPIAHSEEGVAIPFDLKTENPKLYKFINKKFQSITTVQRNNAALDLGSIDLSSGISVVSADSSLTVYTFYIEGNYGHAFYNFVVEQNQAGDIGAPYILAYRPTEEFVLAWNDDQIDFDAFSGTVTKYQFKTLFQGFGPLTRDPSELEECWELIFGNGTVGGGTVGTVPGSEPGSVNIGGGALNVCVSCIPCPCEGHLCGQQCNCRTKPQWIIRDCSGANLNGFQLGIPSTARNSWEDCIELLTFVGVIVRPEPFEDGGNTAGNDDPPTVGNPVDPEVLCNQTALDFMDAQGISLLTWKKSNAHGCCGEADYAGCVWGKILENVLQPVFEFSEEELEWLEEHEEVIQVIHDFRKTHTHLITEVVIVEGFVVIFDSEETIIALDEDGLIFELETDELIDENIPSLTGWLSCNSFDFGSPDGTPELLVSGVDLLNFSWNLGNGITKSVGPFSVDVRLKRFTDNGQVIFEDDAAWCVSTAANLVGKAISVLVSVTPSLTENQILDIFDELFPKTINSPSSGKCNDIEAVSARTGALLQERSDAIYYNNITTWLWNCGL